MRIAQKRSWTLVRKRPRLRDFPAQIVVPQIEAHHDRQIPERFRYLPRQMVVREVERAGEGLELPDIFRDRPGEFVRREVELEQVLHFRPNTRRNFAGELVTGENETLQLLAILELPGNRTGEGVVGEIDILNPRQVTDRGRESTGEIVTVEEYAMQRRRVEELRRDRTVKVVAVKVKSPEVDQGPELRGNIPAKVTAGDGNSDDPRVIVGPTDVHAGNAGPLARRGIVLVPVGEDRTVRWLINGGLQGQQREAVLSESETELRNPRVSDEEEEDQQLQVKALLLHRLLSDST